MSSHTTVVRALFRSALRCVPGLSVGGVGVRRPSWRLFARRWRPGAMAQVVADRHGISTGLIYTWRKQMLRVAMAGFAAVEIKPDAPSGVAGPCRTPSRRAARL